jgi:transcriptional regulator with XRE-family HTH domain
MPEFDGFRQRSFGHRLDSLFRNTRKPGSAKGYSVREVAAALGWSHTHLSNLRSGRAADPRLTEMQALANFFGVPLSYFTGEDAAEPPSSRIQLRLLNALADPSIERVALRMADAELSEQGAAAVLAMIDQVRLLERAAQQRDESDEG